MASYLTPEQDQRLRRWERINKAYFIFAFLALVIWLAVGIQELENGEPRIHSEKQTRMTVVVQKLELFRLHQGLANNCVGRKEGFCRKQDGKR